MRRNERGVVTTEFIFAIVICAGLSALLFSVTYTLSVIEVTQYVVYSAARAQVPSNTNPDLQREAARAKFKQLTTGKSAIATLYSGNWFAVGKAEGLDIRSGRTGDGRTFGNDLAGGADLRSWFIGVSTPFTAKILNFKLPFLGSTNPDDDDNSFKTHVSAMLIREPSQKECKDFFEKRRSALGQLPSGQHFYQPASYLPVEDNGC